MGIFSSDKESGRNLINLDGSPYERRFLPKGLRDVGQAVGSPAVLVSLAAGFAATAVELCTKGSGSFSTLGIACAAIGPFAGAAINKFYYSQEAIVAKLDKNIAIDKSAWTSPGQDQAFKAVLNFRICAADIH